MDARIWSAMTWVWDGRRGGSGGGEGEGGCGNAGGAFSSGGGGGGDDFGDISGEIFFCLVFEGMSSWNPESVRRGGRAIRVAMRLVSRLGGSGSEPESDVVPLSGTAFFISRERGSGICRLFVDWSGSAWLCRTMRVDCNLAGFGPGWGFLTASSSNSPISAMGSSKSLGMLRFWNPPKEG